MTAISSVPSRPFINIVEAERRHIEAPADIFDRYELPLPHNTWPERVPRYDSLAEVCAPPPSLPPVRQQEV